METKLTNPLWPDRSPMDCDRFGVLVYGWDKNNPDPYTAPYNKWLLEIDADQFKRLLLGESDAGEVRETTSEKGVPKRVR